VCVGGFAEGCVCVGGGVQKVVCVCVWGGAEGWLSVSSLSTASCTYVPVGSTSCVEEVVTVVVTVVRVNGPGGMNGPLTATDTCSGHSRYFCMLKRKWVHGCGYLFFYCLNI
jgi:hypothetical protein